ncbi:MAG: glutathione S-transferase [Myxococcales bacterium]|nr:glutathione S-transferase [Myxococcales bacterium]
MASRPLRLITIGFSHFCEKARWALDRAGLEYREEDHAPLLHWRASLAAGGGRTVPVLVTPERVLRESTDILHYCDAQAPAERRLFPQEPEPRAEVEALVADYDRGLGPAVRRFVYFHLLRQREAAVELLGCTGPRWERGLVRRIFPAMAGMLRRGLKITPEGAQRSASRLEATLAAVEARLADGRRYLTGDRFTAADLTFAALGAIVVLPPAYGFPIPTTAGQLPTLTDFIEATRARPAGRFIARMYAEERPPPLRVAA